MPSYESGLRGNGRGGDSDRNERMRDFEIERWHRSGRDLRADLDRRTDRWDVDRRHMWNPERREFGGGERERMIRESEFEHGGRQRGRWEGTDWRSLREDPERMRRDLDRRTNRESIDRRHDWHPARSFGGGSPGSYGEYERGSSSYGSSGGYGRDEGYGRYGAGPGGGGRDLERFGPDTTWHGGGYGGYGGGEYGGSYGGMGPGPEGIYEPADDFGGGLSGAGSMSGSFGYASGWEPERMNMRYDNRSTAEMMRERRRGWQREGPMVRDVMTRDPRYCSPDSSAREAARLMREEDAGIIPVVQDGRVIGVVTDRDLAMRVMAEGKNADDCRVRDVMSTDVHVCTADDRLVDAVQTMGEESVRRLPVVDRDDRLIGMISMTDIAREAEMDYALQEALEQLAARRSFWTRW